MNKVQLTQEGFEKLKTEHGELLKKKRPHAISRLQKARSMGDLSENSEYSTAKEELAFVEGRIQEIEMLLKNAEVVETHHNGNIVSLGDKVTVQTSNRREEFFIVGEFEADPMQKKLSNTSPIGRALLGKKIGEEVDVLIPAGKIQYKVVDIK